MKKLSKFLLTISVALLFLVPVTVSAQENAVNEEDISIDNIIIDSNLSLDKKTDGRVYLQMRNSDNSLTVSQQRSVLEEMGFSEKEIEKMSPAIIQEISLNGGKKVDTQTTIKQYYNSSDGKKYLVTNENRKEIEALSQKETGVINKPAGQSSNIGMMSDVREEYPFTGTGYVIYRGKTSNAKEFIYDYYNTASWAEPPYYKYIDKLANSWQSFATSVGREATLTTWLTPQLGNESKQQVTIEGINGSSVKFDHAGLYLYKNLVLKETVTIPVSYKGLTGKHIAKYAHPYTLLTPSVTVGPISLNFSNFIGSEWDWDVTFTIDSK
ncbi:hypothetical protein [Paenibacillus polysaccharolyticus]|uniref:hypothetical protein n=1 Tax=Paenibacillus TaxID=44249 RepID=UPI00280AD45D|nr:hypothetical protein [Paenibacillus polysaccharolyticus]